VALVDPNFAKYESLGFPPFTAGIKQYYASIFASFEEAATKSFQLILVRLPRIMRKPQTRNGLVRCLEIHPSVHIKE
jgi:hypothetical protein